MQQRMELILVKWKIHSINTVEDSGTRASDAFQYKSQTCVPGENRCDNYCTVQRDCKTVTELQYINQPYKKH